ncbi:SusC/RagA family TonB-linked outer membrane protein [Hymenobacter jeollabukensis]|uniref:TonB-dependent receptor n=1 Tax=Hymenobacter jeollabukensis TaxID=2025313 RepID=A0A5R8WR58_9BACT|nr:TonB-dependent receptor [Hymenobacter jeollabukensis]TLM92430.1 TonB-dependent receptor [Hymenobacter jeollabukensis]
MNKLLLGLIPLAAVVHQANAQTRSISGRVTDRNTGEGIPGVTIVVPGTTVGVSTNADGSYVLDLPAGSKNIRISSVGYQTIERSVGNETTLNIGLATDTKMTSEVVVTGYGGSQDVKDITGSFAKLDQSKLTSQPIQSADQALAGRIAGVQITNTSGTLGDAVTVRIRGINSINGSSQPLFVVDGVPMTEFGNMNVMTSGLRYNPLADINPNDIESMTVLKDASAAAIYGSRATNGVVLITTKKGKNGQAKLTVNATVGYMEPTKLPKLLDATEFRDITNEKYFNANPGKTVPLAINGDSDGDGVEDNTDWLKQIYHKGFMQDYQLALSSGNDKGSYYASVGYSDQKGTIITNRLRRANGRINMELTPKTWVKSGMNLSFNHAYNQGILGSNLTSNYFASPTFAAMNSLPNVPAYNADGSYYLTGVTRTLGSGANNDGEKLDATGATIGENLFSYVPFALYHPVATLRLNHNDNTQRRLLGNAYLTVMPLKGLSVTTKFGLDYLNNAEYQYSAPDIAGLGLQYNGLVQKNRADNTLTTWQNYAAYSHLFGDNHNIDATLGYEQNLETYQLVFSQGSNISDPKFKDNFFGLFDSQASSQGTSQDVSAWQSIFGRLNYAFSDKYYATFTARRDGSSRFGEQRRWGFFPGTSVGWRISREAFMSNISFVNDLKLKASYGLVGNSAGISSYESATLMGQGLYGTYAGYAINRLNNPSLRWETGKKLDVGFDASVMKDRIGVNFDYFSNNIDNLLLYVPAIYSTGIPNGSVFRNVGKMYNRGVELTLNTTNLETPSGFKWTSSFNYTYLVNRITKLEGGNVPSGVPYHFASEGHSITEYNLLRWVGVNPDNGNPQWLDANDNVREYSPVTKTWTQNGESRVNGQTVRPATTATEGVWLGKTSFPKWNGGFDNTFSYKGLQLEVFLQYSGGNYLYNSTRSQLLTNSAVNNSEEIKDRWQKPGDVTNVPRLYVGDNIHQSSSTRFMEKGDYLRVRQVRLSYLLPSTVTQRIGSSRTNLFVMVQNAYVFTKYSGTDPEVNVAGNEGSNSGTNSNIAYGVDQRSNPQVRTYTAGVNIDF